MNYIDFFAATDIVRRTIGCSIEDAVLWIRETAKETGLLSEDRIDDNVRFLHLTFCEFLCAHYMINYKPDGWDDIIRTHRHYPADHDTTRRSRLREVIPFCAGQLPPHMQAKALSDICRLEDIQLGAHAFLETKLYDIDLWPRFLSEQLSLLTTQVADDGISESVFEKDSQDSRNVILGVSDPTLRADTDAETEATAAASV